MILNIVGGTYYEICRDPAWSELYGSGLRAVHALCDGSATIKFYTNIGVEDYPLLSSISNALNFDLITASNNFTATFNYDYPLANPTFYKPVESNNTESPIEGDFIIQFGMVEGNKKVKAKTVVYDPQSPDDPKSFWSNGSIAQELIWISNLKEAATFTGFADIGDIKSYLFNVERVTAAIIKKGTDGAILFQKDEQDINIPLFKTKHVWPIGTGDIYTATFGYNYLVNKLSIQEAAIKASLSTAYYTETIALPIPNFIDESKFEKFYKKPNKTKKVYLAGPFFTMSQRWLVEQFRNQLVAFGLNVFSPYHDVGIGPFEEVAIKDIQAIHECDLILAIVDGLDSGTLFEIGYGRALKLPVVIFSENEKEGALTMLRGTECIIENDFSTVIYKTIWELYKS